MKLKIQAEKLANPEYRKGVLDALNEIVTANNTVLDGIDNNSALTPNQKSIGGSIIRSCTRYATGQIDLVNELVAEIN